MGKRPYLKDVLPSLAKKIEERLVEEGFNTLAESVDQLQIHKLFVNVTTQIAVHLIQVNLTSKKNFLFRVIF